MLLQVCCMSWSSKIYISLPLGGLIVDCGAEPIRLCKLQIYDRSTCRSTVTKYTNLLCHIYMSNIPIHSAHLLHSLVLPHMLSYRSRLPEVKVVTGHNCHKNQGCQRWDCHKDQGCLRSRLPHKSGCHSDQDTHRGQGYHSGQV